MTATVYFTDFKANSRENLLEKLARLMATAGLDGILDKNDLTAVKLHFGEMGNTAFIRPPFVRRIARAIRERGAIPFLTDANTLYAGTRSDSVSHITTAIANGFSYSSMDSTPIIIADGLRGKSETSVQVGLKHCSEVHIGKEIVAADALVSVAHFKGHELSGFGGTLKNLGMGCASRKGKLDQHSTVSPKIKRKTCIGCGACVDNCPVKAITLEDDKATINPEVCIGCGECIIRCPTGSVNIRWNQTIPVFLEKMMEYTKGVISGKEDKTLFINFITDISPACDCLPYNDAPIVRDIGIVASTDPVAIDQASVDLVNQQQAFANTRLKHNREPGEDKFRGLYPDVDWEIQLDYAETIGLGTRTYELVKLKSLTWKKEVPENQGH
ncbi:ferredoxin (iron-sulfur cluster-binding protein) [Desulforapulum autotrophicum HRM2]|uniref:Ferredoxin (Iron-sulfur cluster-binding protein) n=1 Tax=Desulforapulum autotrophicum (strain ATCC 43914 / DSM 3382 / VKM B-1955 / HRM2) TaxID=177437 RepID=C0QCZ9_DESAH|nr:DUF362 domain-containing protein [Desulforapulum autotrophicum]ACN17231.1 ferredoxin (iron-sulfur cluster-binding protein) [Desulforapulum autotrophicum HRM2]